MLWMERTWTELAAVDRARTPAFLPIGAIEAHGPHLPLGTDGIISQGMAEEAVRQLGCGLILPCLDFTVATFAADFPGTLGFRPSTVRAVLEDLCLGLARLGFPLLAVANSHLDPAHLRCLHEAFRDPPLPVVFPDLTRRRLAARLTEEFQSGACHAGQFEGSVVAARRPDLVRWDVARALPDNPSSLVTAIQAGQSTFAEAGGPEAYFGSPGRLTAEEGEATLAALGAILAEAVRDAWSAGPV